ncbi:NAD(P)/FAD-dependent oxidoreductase [Mycolicibacterium sp. 018/SC-01/001]|uniref:NAD(P)/FAD-dependent oxidoreductase n=1 Tax=Mycolicibacterium sp. 018/SC-01/001 TaxID=2592069 RepID=UPI00117C3071|nr:FAD-dependent oxidoreductase [Mycolicibacterium sp. 018/SC-01/001]TRW85490.1 NAD(P)/FAD-dependent oxidoreductase [Mycolicibacterium sp. 018/SC-01/001]
MKHIAVVGASLAGLSAVRALRAQGFSGRITVIGDENRRPYDRPPLSKDFLAGVITEDDLCLDDGDELAAEWLLGSAATALDTATNTVELADGRRVQADGFVIATGSRARRWPGSETLAGVHVIRTIDDAIALRAELSHGGQMVVIGAGFIGAEVASTARGLGMNVTIVEAAPTPLQVQLGARLGAVVAQAHEMNGTTLICGVGVAGLTSGPADRVTGVELVDGRHLPADVVVVGIGGVPNIEWLRGSGVDLGNGVLCGPDGRTNIAGVVAVGDCAAWFDPSTGGPRRVEHWTGALERPSIAVAALLSDGIDCGAPAKAPYFWSDQYGSRIQFAGITFADDEITIEAGSCESGSFLATYRRDGRLVAVLGVDQPKLFTRWRRQLAPAPVSV